MEQHFFFQEGLGNGTSKERPSPDDSGSMELEAIGPALRPYIMIYFHMCVLVYLYTSVSILYNIIYI